MDEIPHEQILIENAQNLIDEGKFEKALDLLSDDIILPLKSERLLNMKAGAYLDLERPLDGLTYAEKALEINNQSSDAYYYKGWANRLLGTFSESEKNLLKSIELDETNYLAIWELGNTYHEMKIRDKEILAFRQLIEDVGVEGFIYYKLGEALFDDGQYEEARNNFAHYLNSEKTQDYFRSNAQSKIEEINKILKDKSYDEINKIITSIKSILLFEDECITHYTSLDVTSKLVLGEEKKHGLKEESLLRLSEGAFLNDPSEGSELFKLFEYTNSHTIRNSVLDPISKQFVSKPFIGSYVAKIKENDLTLWRMYGKNNKEEAKGCAITMNRERFLNAISKKLIVPLVESKRISELLNKKNHDRSNLKEDINFYRVAYKTHNNVEFSIPGANGNDVKELNHLFENLIEKVNDVFLNDAPNSEGVLNLKELLNDIAYLVKSEEYIFENEVRLIVKGIGFDKMIELDSMPPRVYVELVTINPLITQITLGPKVDRAEEWAAAFHYHLTNEGYAPEIHISHLPFK